VHSQVPEGHYRRQCSAKLGGTRTDHAHFIPALSLLLVDPLRDYDAPPGAADPEPDRSPTDQDRTLQQNGGRHRRLLMLNEFPALGRLDLIESALAFMAGYGLKSFLIAQSLNHIEKAYGSNNSVLDVFGSRAATSALAPRRSPT